MNSNSQSLKKSTVWRSKFGVFVVLVLATVGLLSSYGGIANAATPPPIVPPPSGKPVDACPKGECIINDYINPVVKALSATVGVIVVISLVVAGIQYSSAAGDPSKVGAAKSRIIKTLGAFLFFIFLYVFLNYIVPGGV